MPSWTAFREYADFEKERVVGMTLGDFVAAARARIQEITAEELDLRLEDNEDILLVDVREPDEFARGHIPGALNVPRGLLEGAADPGYRLRIEPLCSARERSVIVYCETGGRSAMAAAVLQDMGFAQVANLAGGSVLWAAEGLPLVTD